MSSANLDDSMHDMTSAEIRDSVSPSGLDVSIVMPCLNEALSLEVCIHAAMDALAQMQTRFGLSGEVLIADNGSTDGSQALAARLGARVVQVPEKGYGAALRGGFRAAYGRYLVMGDADGSYEFRESVAMVEALTKGADLCMGSRFRGGVKRGAMPWMNRYIGNPVLTGVLNLLFHTGVGDAHCGLRALTKPCFERLGLSGAGMEFASEMVIKASLVGAKIVEVPATLSPDLRNRPPHLRPWRDGWRHLRYLFMLSPTWLFAVPALLGGTGGVAILGTALWYAVVLPDRPFMFGNYWDIFGGSLVGVSHVAGILAFASHLNGVKAGYRRSSDWVTSLAGWLTLESMILIGLLALVGGFATLGFVVVSWTERNFGPTTSVLPAVLGTSLATLGLQNILGGFLLSIVSGNEARFLGGR